jgi:hypothetical protein
MDLEIFLTRPQVCEIVKRYYVLFLAVTLSKIKKIHHVQENILIFC